MTKTTVEVEAQFNFQYDENSKEFKEALASYKELIEANGDIDSMLCHVVHNLINFGWRTLVEGVGYVSCGRFSKPDSWCGIHVENAEPDFDYDVI